MGSVVDVWACPEHPDVERHRNISGNWYCPKCKKEYNRKWYQTKGSHQSSEYHRMYNWVNKCEAACILGCACVVCGETDVVVLQFDHINGGGNAERRNGGRGSGSHNYLWIIANPEEAKAKYQVLCANCHMRKSANEARSGYKVAA